MTKLGVSLMLTAFLASCAPNIYGRGPAGQDIPFVWNAVVRTIPLAGAGETTPPEQYVTLPGCPRSAVQLRYVRQYVRQYGLEAAQVACASALEGANRNAGVSSAVLGVLVLPAVGAVLGVLYLLLHALGAR